MTETVAVTTPVEEAEGHVRQGRAEDAMRLFLAAIEAGDGSARVWNGLGVCRFALGDAPGAEEAFGEALDIDPGYVEALANLADLAWSQGRRVDYLPLARRILTSDASDASTRERLRVLGVETPLPAKALLVGSLLRDDAARDRVATGLAEAGWLVTAASAGVLSVLDLETYVEAASPSLLVVEAADDDADGAAAIAAAHDVPVLWIGARPTAASSDRVLAADASAASDLAAEILASRLEIPSGGPDPNASPLATVLVCPRDDAPARETVDRALLQDLDPALFEIVVVDPEGDVSLDDLDRAPCTIRVVRDEAEIEARGRWILTALHRDLGDPDALRRRLLEVARARTTTFASENLHPRTTARAVALVRGWNGTDLTARCLESLRRYATSDELRIVYVDNGSDPGAFAELVEAFPDVEFHRHPTNLGSCRGINSGFAVAALEPHEFVLLLDNDTEVPEGDRQWLERWMGAFEDPEVGAAGAVTDQVVGLQHHECTPETYRRAWEHDGRSGQKGPPVAPVLVSFAVMFRRAALEDIGWLADERFEPGNSEDYDLCLRMGERGWKSIVAQSVWIHHAGSQTFSRLDFRDLLRTNLRKLVEKYGVERLRRLGVEVRHAR